MAPRLNRDDAIAWHERWKAVNAAQREQERKTLPEVRFRRWAMLRAAYASFGWKRGRKDEEAVREVWARLRAHYSAKP